MPPVEYSRRQGGPAAFLIPRVVRHATETEFGFTMTAFSLATAIVRTRCFGFGRSEAWRRGFQRVPLVLLLLGLLPFAGVILASPTRVEGAVAEVGEVGSPRRWKVDHPSRELGDALVRALQADQDLLWRGHPRAPRDLFVQALRERAEAALQNGGYAEARVDVRVESSATEQVNPALVATKKSSPMEKPVVGNERVVLRVREGTRFVASDIKITGVDGKLTALLRERLTNPSPPPDCTSASVVRSGKSAIEWRMADGQLAELRPAFWKIGEPAPCDRTSRENARKLVAQLLAEQGYEGARFLLDVRRGTDGKAQLDLRVVELGPEAVVREVTIVDPATAPRHNVQQLKDYLNIKDGQRVTQLDRARWSQRLIDSGRFRKCDVEWKWRSGSGVDVRLSLVELDGVPPLGEPLASDQEALLRCRQWVLGWREHQHDWVVERIVKRADAGEQTTSRWTVAPDQGVLVEYGLATKTPVIWLATSAGIGCVLPNQGRSWQLPLGTDAQIVGNVTVRFNDGDGSDKHPHTLNFGLGVNSSAERAATSPVRMDMRIDPAVVLSSLRQADGRAQVVGEELQWRNDNVHFRVEIKSGRLVELNVQDDNGRWRVTTAPRAFARQSAQFTQLKIPNRFDAKAPLISTCRFFGEENTWKALVQLERDLGWSTGVADSSELVSTPASTPGDTAGKPRADAVIRDNVRDDVPGLGLAKFLSHCAESGLLERLDKGIRTWHDSSSGSNRIELTVPKSNEPIGAENPMRALAWFCVSLADMVFEREEWPSTLVRAGAGMLAGETKYMQYDVTRMYVSKEVGPIGFLTGSAVIPVPVMAATFAQEGRSRLKTANFRHDRDLLLRLLDRGEMRETFVGLLRSLSDEQAADWSAWCLGDERVLRSLVVSLRSAPTVADAAQRLPELLDAWWEQGLRERLEEELRTRSTLETARVPAKPSEAPAR